MNNEKDNVTEPTAFMVYFKRGYSKKRYLLKG